MDTRGSLAKASRSSHLLLKSAAAILLLGAFNSAWALAARGVLSNIKGQVIVKHGEDNSVAVDNTRITAGDVILTFGGSSAKVRLHDCTVNIGPDSLFAVKSYKNCKTAQANVIAMDPSFMPKQVKLTPAQIRTKKQVKKASRDVGRLFDEPGVLTPRGKWIIEPSFAYSHSTATKVAIQGLSVLPAVAIGLIDVSEVQRNTVTGALSFRYGISNRIEIETKVPYTYRTENSRRRDVGVGTSGDKVNGTDGAGIGDLELSLRYQITAIKPHKPYFLGNLRLKSRTGIDPFEVKRREIINQQDGNVIGSELLEQPTGSGFWALQPSVTMVYPTEPSVLFGNISYLVNFSRDIGGDTGVVDPGDAIGFNFGIGFSVNPRTSFSLGYDHSIVLKTKTQSNGIDATFDTIQIGTLLVGLSHVTASDRNLSLSLGIGATDQSTDIQLSFKTPFNLF